MSARWKRTTFLISQRDRPRLRVKGHVSPCGIWGLYRSAGGSDPAYCLTHVPSGLKAGTLWCRLMDAKIITDAIRSGHDTRDLEAAQVAVRRRRREASSLGYRPVLDDREYADYLRSKTTDTPVDETRVSAGETT